MCIHSKKTITLGQNHLPSKGYEREHMHVKEHASCLTKLSYACKNRYRENDLVHQIVSPAVRFIMGLFDQQLLFSMTK